MTISVPPCEAPVTADDATIADALLDADIPTLLLTLVHLSGDTRLLDGPMRPTPVVPRAPFAIRMTEAESAQVRALAFDAIRSFRDGGCRLPPAPDRATVQKMMNFYMGEQIPDEYVTMIMEELALDGVDARAAGWERPVAAERLNEFHVTIIGAGMSGLLAAIRLQEAGIPYTVIEKNAQPGGTWFENTYPGCRVDIPNHFYSYSFKPNHGWSEYFSQRDELFDYFKDCVARYSLDKHIRLSTEVTQARYVDGRWELALRRADGSTDTLVSNVVISAAGMLNRPSIPDIPGKDSFRGVAMHTARWDRACRVDGQRVAVIGSGASGFQLVPELAKRAAQVTVFQRTPNWMSPRPNYHERVSDRKQWLLRHLPYYARWYRFILFWALADAMLPALKKDPAWPHPERSMNELNDQGRIRLTEYMSAQIRPDKRELIDKVIPKYPPGGKRPLTDNGSWLRALQADNVELVDQGIARIVEDGVVDATGRHHPADIIAFATGFKAAEFLWPMHIVGKDGTTLAQAWGDDPKTLLGMTVPNFPNFFCLYGPGTNPGHGGSVIFQAECQVRYVMACVRALLERGLSSIECREAASNDYTERLQHELSQMVWAHPAVSSYYRGRSGRVVTNMPWRLIDYWKWTRQPDWADFEWA